LLNLAGYFSSNTYALHAGAQPEEKDVKAAIRKTPSTPARNTLYGIFLQGLAITLPLTLTIAFLYWLGAMAEDFLGGLIQYLFPAWQYWTGLGTLLAIAMVFVAGILMNLWITRRLITLMDALLERVPLVKSIYGSLRDVANLLSSKDSKSGFKKVVAVRVTEQIRLIGFVTLEDFAGMPHAPKGSDKDTVGVYLPMSYQIGGYTVFLPKSLLEPLDMSIEDAMRFTLTAGVSGRKTDAS
jgi:uncharacterized membrane protein